MSSLARIRRLAAVFATLAVVALPAAAFAHPGHDGGETSAPAPTQQQAPPDEGGGASPLLIVGIVIGGLALAGGLYAAKELQTRPAEPASREAAPKADPKPGAAQVTDPRGVSPEAGA
jgi:hypothetical protein